MCGIVGVISRSPVNQLIYDALLLLQHRGQDAAGNAYSEEEAQPFYVNAPYGIVLVHNGNLTNAAVLKQELIDVDRRHINTQSDTEVLLNVLAHELEAAVRERSLSPATVFDAV